MLGDQLWLNSCLSENHSKLQQYSAHRILRGYTILHEGKQNPIELSLPDNDIVSKSEQEGRTLNLQFYNESDTIQMSRVQEKNMR